MKIKKVEGYEPGYPKKKNVAVIGAAAAAVMISLGSAACRPQVSGNMEIDPSELPGTTGGIAIETDEPVGLMGDVAVDFTDLPALQGKIVLDTDIPEATPGADNGQ
ncbi:MAG: hypothetical protein K6F68_01715 [Clostridiales bacterium]|nr:hypothetical protein [Clostridiales bacterium]